MNAIKIYIGLLLVFVFASCYEDKGDYDYHEINEVKISGLEEQYEINRWDTLIISSAKMENSLTENADLRFAWYLDYKKIGDTKDLNYIISDKAGVYQARFEVLEPAADSVRFFYDFKVIVRTQYAQGLMLLSDNNGVPELSFMSTLDNPERIIAHDIFKVENKQSLAGIPLSIEQPDVWGYGGTIWVHTSVASHQLDPILFREVDRLDKNTFTEPVEECDMIFCSYSQILSDFGAGLGRDGKIYPKVARQDRYLSASLKPIHDMDDLDKMYDYELSPMLLCSRDAALGYDNLSGKFLYFTNSYDVPSFDENQYDVVRPSATHVGLPWFGWGINMNTNNYRFTSLFFDKKTGKAALARQHSQTGKMIGQDSLVILSQHNIHEGSKMVVNSANNRLYYSDGGNKIYMINISDPEFKYASTDLGCPLPDDCKITMMKVAHNNLSLYIGVQTNRKDGYCGDLYKISARDGHIEEYYEGFGGIPVDLIEKVPVEGYDTEE